MRKLGIAPKAHDFKEGSFFVNDWADTVTNQLKTVGTFRAHRATTAQAIASASYTAVIYNSEDFDTDGWYDITTGKFTPKVAGYYWIEGQVKYSMPATVSTIVLDLTKNGLDYNEHYVLNAGVGGTYTPKVSGLMYLNGSTDYAQIFAYQNTGSSQNIINNAASYFTGFLVKAA